MKRYGIVLIASGILQMVSGCGQNAADDAPAAAVPPTEGEQEVEILCHFAYRSSIFSGDFESVNFTITIPFTDGPAPDMPLGIEDSVDFANLRCIAIGHYNSLHLQVLDTESGNFITSVLYQFAEPPENRFAGGHGFTGLHYVYPPETEAELQFWASLSARASSE